MRFSDFLLVSDPTDLNFIVGYTDDQNIRINVLDLFTGQIIGSGTPGYVPLFTAANVIDDSVIFQHGSNIVIGGVDSLGYKLAVSGSLYSSNGAVINSTVSGADALRVIGGDGDIFVIPNDLGQSISSLRRIIHPPAVLTTESATLGQVNTAISNLEEDIEILLDLKVDKTSVGEPNGVASLDATGKIPLSEIPDSIIGQVEYMGTWNAFTNTPTLNPLVPEQKGHYYVVSAAGVFGGVDYAVGDWIISNGVEWQKVDNTDAVTSVFGRIGAILPLEADYQSFYPRLSQAYDNPTWINSLAFSKITGVPPFLLENQTITLSGDVTGSGKTSISTTISDNSVTDSKLRNSVGTSVIGRASNSTGDPADIQASTDGHVLLRSAGNLLFGLISSDSISSINWSKITGTPTTLSGYGITDAYTKTESDNKFVPYTGANANVNLGSNNITANSFIKAGGTSSQFLKADGSVDTSQYVPTTRSINAGTGLTGGGNLSSDVNISFDTTWGDTRYAYRTRQLTINGVTYDLSADRTWSVGTVTSISTNGPITGGIITGSGTIGITQSSASTDGYLSSTDWNTFNSKQPAGDYVTIATDQTITGLKTIVRSGDVLNFKIGTDTLYGLKVAYNQNELVPSGEATWSFVNTFNRDGVGYSVTPLSFFRGVLVTGERLISSSVNSNLLDYYSNNPTGRYPVYAYNTGVQQFSESILVGYNTGLVNAVTGAIASLPSGVVANFNGRVIGSNAVNSNEFVTLSQITGGFVPYTGATQDVNLGTYGLTSDFVRFNTTNTSIPSAEGVMWWDNTDGTVRLSVQGNIYSVPIGQSVISKVRNNTGVDLLRTNYQVVKISGAQGQRLAVTLAQANNDLNSASTLGLVCENISKNQEGFVINIGQIININTTGSLQGETWNDGDVLYLSPTIAGAITNVKPVAPQHTVILGYVEYAHANNGKIYVKIDNGYELEELHDVAPTPYINNGLLYRDTTLNLWKSATISTILGYTPAPQGNYITALTGEVTAAGPGSVAATLSNSAVTGKVLTGLNITGNAIVSTDSILTAFGKLQNQVNQLVGGLQYEGTWNASTNTPTITSSVGTDGTFYIVSVAGTTNINGINDWQVGDWIVFHDTSWQKVDNSDSVSSVFGRVGNIVANQSDYSAFYPLIADIKDGVLTVQGTGVLSGSGTFSANQATNNTITLTHNSVSRTDTTSTQTPSFGGSFTVVDSVTSSAQGHITAINTKTVTVPSTIATSTQTGLLSNTDWVTFNSKMPAITFNAPLFIASGGEVGITQASGSTNGFLSSTDWNTFNNKQNALTNPVTGTGTTNYLPKFTGTSTIGNSQVFDNGTNVGIGTASPSNKLDVLGTAASPNLIATNAYARFYQSGGFANVTIGALASGSFAGWIQTSDGVGTSLPLAIQPSGGNLLVGTTTDNGARLHVSGRAYINNVGGSVAGTTIYGNDQANVRLRLENVSGRTWELTAGLTGANNSDFTIYDVTAAATRLVINSSGNLGLGVTPSAGGLSGYVLFELANGGASIYSGPNQNLSGANISWSGGTASYKISNFATLYNQQSGQHQFYTAPSGTAGNAISFTQAMTLTSGGNLLVGTTTDAGFKLDVNGTGRFSASGSTNLVVQRTGSNGVFMQLLDASGNSVFLGGNNGDFQVQTPSGGFSNKLVVTNTGNVGIGTTSPQVAGGGYTGLHINGSGSSLVLSTSGANLTYLYTLGTGGVDFAIENSGAQIFRGGSSERMRITSGGNVGIGTASPTNGLLVINSTASNGVRFALESSGTMNGIVALGSNAISGLSTSDLALWTRGIMAFETGASGEKMRITSGGNVGIGTSSPSAVLEVQGGNGNQLDLDNTGQQFTQLNFRHNGTQRSAIWIDNTNSLFEHYVVSGYGQTFYTNATERMRITSAGNVLIGTTTDGGARLQIVSSGVALNMATSNGQMANINSTNANGGYITWQTSGTTIADLGTAQQIFGSGGNDTFGINGRGARALTFGTNDTERMRITSGGNVLVGNTSAYTSRLTVQAAAGNRPAIKAGFGVVAGNGYWVLGDNYTLDESLTSYGIDYSSGDLVLGSIVAPSTTTSGAFISTQAQFGNLGSAIRAGNSGDIYFFRGTSTSVVAVGGAKSMTESMRLNSSGNLLIGTNSDNGARLQVSGTATFSSTSGNQLRIAYDNSYYWTLSRVAVDGRLAFVDSFNGEKLTLTTSGNVGIGTSNPAQRLSVAGEIAKYCTASGVDGNFENLIKYGFSGDLQSGTGAANRWVGIDATITAGAAVVNTLRVRAYPGTTGNASPVNVADFRGDQSSVFYGNVGIGTTNPISKLHVNGTMRTILTSGVGGDTLIAAINGVTNGYIINVDTSNNTTHTWHTGTNTPSLRITPGGNVLIGTTTDAGYTLNVAGNAQFIKSSTSTAMVVGLSGVTGSVIRFSYNGGFVGSISTDGSNTAYNTSSDYRLKEQVRAIDNPLEKVMKLNPVNFKYKNSKTVQDGFIAHEIQEILPYLVTGEKDGAEMQEVDYSKLTPILIAAIKELKQEIDKLRNK